MRRIESKETQKDLFMFVFLGIPILILGQLRDAYDFMSLTYRDDIKDFSSDSEFQMTEAQFSDLEAFCQEELKKLSASSFDTE